MSLYFEVITDREVILFKSQSAEAVELWMSRENHMTRVEYALTCLDPVDLPECDRDRTPMVDLLSCLNDGFRITVDGNEEDLLALAVEFFRRYANDFPSAILFYPPKAGKP